MDTKYIERKDASGTGLCRRVCVSVAEQSAECISRCSRGKCNCARTHGGCFWLGWSCSVRRICIALIYALVTDRASLAMRDKERRSERSGEAREQRTSLFSDATVRLDESRESSLYTELYLRYIATSWWLYGSWDIAENVHSVDLNRVSMCAFATLAISLCVPWMLLEVQNAQPRDNVQTRTLRVFIYLPALVF